jgi:hypothetical protein
MFDRTQLSLLASSLRDSGCPAETSSLNTEYFGIERPTLVNAASTFSSRTWAAWSNEKIVASADAAVVMVPRTGSFMAV